MEKNRARAKGKHKAGAGAQTTNSQTASSNDGVLKRAKPLNSGRPAGLTAYMSVCVLLYFKYSITLHSNISLLFFSHIWLERTNNNFERNLSFQGSLEKLILKDLCELRQRLL